VFVNVSHFQPSLIFVGKAGNHALEPLKHLIAVVFHNVSVQSSQSQKHLDFYKSKVRWCPIQWRV